MKHINKLFLLICSLTVSNQAFSQNISKQDIASVVAKIASLVKDKYVFEDKAQSISDGILLKLKRGEFVHATDWNGLADSLTVALQELSDDEHMYVRNDPKKIKELIESRNDTTGKSDSSTYEGPFFFGKDAIEKNFGFREVKVLKNNIGYIKLSEVNISAKSLPTLYAVMRFVHNTKALIIDLRDNGGGGSDVGAVFPSYFLPRDVVLLEFKSRTGETHTDRTVSWLTEAKYDKPLYILVNGNTRSAAEAFAFSLQHQKRATIVGKRSQGAAHMNEWYVVNDEIFVSISTAAPTIPGTEISWEGTGVKPDVEVETGKEIDFILEDLK